MKRYSTEPRTRKYVKGYEFLLLARNISIKYRKNLFDTAAKTGLEAVKNASKQLIHKIAEATGKFRGDKNTEKIMKLKPMPDINSRNIRDIVTPPEKRRKY